MARRVYLDHAATTWPKCPPAVEASYQYLQSCGATAGRGAYASAREAESWLAQARVALARLVGAQSRQIAFCHSGTHALNVLLQGLIPSGSHVLTSAMEHNSVLRPLAQQRTRGDLSFDVIPVDSHGVVQLKAAYDLVQDQTSALVLGHASNVTGAANDLARWGEFACEMGLRFIVDVSQSLGYLPVDCEAMQVSAVASAGHKGLRGMPGTGFIMLQEELQAELKPMLFGGTGLASEDIEQPPAWPHSVEVGNVNVPGIISMAVAAEELLGLKQDLTVGWMECYRKLVHGLNDIQGITVIAGPDAVEAMHCVPVVSIQVEGWDIHDLAAVLDGEFQIEVRTGLHCAALIHAAIDSLSTNGTLRLSTGRSTTLEEVEYTLSAFKEIVG